MMGFHWVRCFHCILKASADARQHEPAIPTSHWIWKQVSIHGCLTLTPRELLSFWSRENKRRGLKQDAWLMQCAPTLPEVHLPNHRPACWVALGQHCKKLTGKGWWEHPGSTEIRTICKEKEVPPAQCCRTVPEWGTWSLKLNLSSRWFVTRESLLCFDNHDMVPTAAVCSTLRGVSLNSFVTVHFPEGKMLL